jgi:hypothetical protein
MMEANGCGVDREPDDRYFAAVSVSGAATQVGLHSWWCSWALSLDFRGENSRSDLYWLYLTMADLYSSPC